MYLYLEHRFQDKDLHKTLHSLDHRKYLELNENQMYLDHQLHCLLDKKDDTTFT